MTRRTSGGAEAFWTTAVLAAGMVALAAILGGCAVGKHTVVASTGTYLGVDVSADAAKQTPHIKVGYGRTELALVPTNRDDSGKPGSRIGEAVRCDGCEKCRKGCGACPNCQGTAQQVVDAAGKSEVTCNTAGKTSYTQKGITDGGAQDSAEVLMEIKAQGSGGMGAAWQGGIYQRLAVGKIAVQQPGASFMFARDNNGELKADVAQAVVGDFAKDDAGDALWAWVFSGPNGDVNDANLNKLGEWLKKSQINVTVPFFLRSATYKEQRQKAAVEMLPKR